MRFCVRPIVVLSLIVCWLCSPIPVWAEVHGGIEIGAKGIRAIVVDIAGADEDPRILMIENKNATLVGDLAAAKRYSPKTLAQTAEIVGEFAKKMRAEFKVPDQRLYIVGSSGIFVPIEGDEPLIQENKQLVTRAIKHTTGITMDFVNITREAELTITSVVPNRFRHDAVLLDIGSGNTKGGAYQKDGALLTFGIPFGTVAFSDRIRKELNDESFASAAQRLRKKLVLPALVDSLKGKEELAKRKKVYLAGGSVWALTTYQKPADRSTFVLLSHGDVLAFHKKLVDSPKELPDLDLQGVDNETARKQTAKDLAAVRKTFSREQLIAGVEVLIALSDGFGLDDSQKQLYFARNGYIGWILGYTLEKGIPAK